MPGTSGSQYYWWFSGGFRQNCLKDWVLPIPWLVENSQDCTWQGLGQAKTGTQGFLVIFLYCLIYLCADHTFKLPQAFSFPAPLLNHVCGLVIYWLLFLLNHRGPVMHKVAPPRSNSEVNNSNNINLRERTVWLRLCGYSHKCHSLVQCALF